MRRELQWVYLALIPSMSLELLLLTSSFPEPSVTLQFNLPRSSVHHRSNADQGQHLQEHQQRHFRQEKGPAETKAQVLRCLRQEKGTAKSRTSHYSYLISFSGDGIIVLLSLIWILNKCLV